RDVPTGCPAAAFVSVASPIQRRDQTPSDRATLTVRQGSKDIIMKLSTLRSASVLPLLLVASPLFGRPCRTSEEQGAVKVPADGFSVGDLKKPAFQWGVR